MKTRIRGGKYKNAEFWTVRMSFHILDSILFCLWKPFFYPLKIYNLPILKKNYIEAEA